MKKTFVNYILVHSGTNSIHLFFYVIVMFVISSSSLFDD